MKKIIQTLGKSFSQTAFFNKITVNVDFEGEVHKLTGEAGDKLVEVAWESDLEVGGFCGGNKICGGCHCYVEEKFFQEMEVDDEEEDLLENGMYDREDNSRLGCQIILDDNMNEMNVKFPEV